MKVLHLIEDLGIGGMERLLGDVLPRLAEYGHEVECACLSRGGPYVEYLHRKGISTTILGKNSYWSPAQIVALYRFVHLSRPDIVHSHGSFANVFTGFASALPSFPSFLLHYHTLWIDHSPKRLLLVERWAAGRSARVLCISMATAKSFLEAGIVAPTKVEIVYNGIDLERFPPSGAREGNAIVCVGSLAPHKGQDVLVRAMEKVREKVGEASLTLVGDGAERARLEDLVEELGLGGAVRFAGRVEDVHEYLRKSKLFVLPSVKREGLGIALLEAMATGLAAVASDCGGVGEIIEHEVNGLLVPQGEHLPLADAIVRLLKNESLASTLAAMGRKTVEERFTIETTCDKLLKIYEEVAGA